jgi:NADH:ubiquinone oxidoreductase subunit 6 (subunit J)
MTFRRMRADPQPLPFRHGTFCTVNARLPDVPKIVVVVGAVMVVLMVVVVGVA